MKKDMHPRKIAMHKIVYGSSLNAAGSRIGRVFSLFQWHRGTNLICLEFLSMKVMDDDGGASARMKYCR
jgi:hypothetical protein